MTYSTLVTGEWELEDTVSQHPPLFKNGLFQERPLFITVTYSGNACPKKVFKKKGGGV